MTNWNDVQREMKVAINNNLFYRTCYVEDNKNRQYEQVTSRKN